MIQQQWSQNKSKNNNNNQPDYISINTLNTYRIQSNEREWDASDIIHTCMVYVIIIKIIFKTIGIISNHKHNQFFNTNRIRTIRYFGIFLSKILVFFLCNQATVATITWVAAQHMGTSQSYTKTIVTSLVFVVSKFVCFVLCCLGRPVAVCKYVVCLLCYYLFLFVLLFDNNNII